MTNESEIEPTAKSTTQQAVEVVKLVGSTCVVMLLVLVAFTGMSNQWCVLQVHPAGLFLILFFCIILLAYVEALHYACKGAAWAAL